MVGKRAKRKDYKTQNVFTVLKNYVLNWIFSIFLKCWVNMHSDVVDSLGQKQFCSLYLCDCWMILSFTQRHQSYLCVHTSLDDEEILRVFALLMYITTIFFHEHRCYMNISDSHFFPSLTNNQKCKLWGFLPAGFQMLWWGM